jgi:hypothetical protein
MLTITTGARIILLKSCLCVREKMDQTNQHWIVGDSLSILCILNVYYIRYTRILFDVM